MNERCTPSLDRLVSACHPLWVCGLVSILVDLDHAVRPIQLLLAGQIPAWRDIAGRPLHPHSFLVCWTICGAIAACSVGQLIVNWLDATGGD